MDDPLVTVVMATYQGDNEDHLLESINSILLQTYRNIEFIIVVDGPVSVERRALFDRLAGSNGIRLLFIAENEGPAAARNLGLNSASGEYIAIMDADDVAMSDRVEHQLQYLTGNNLDLISSFLLVIDDAGATVGTRQLPITLSEIRRIAPFRCPLHNPSAFGKASIFKSFKYEPTMRISEDYHLWIRLLKAGYQLGNSEYCSVKYRQNPSALAKRTGARYAYADLKVKLGAFELVRGIDRPLVLIVGVAAAAIRLLPARLFSIFYYFRRFL